MTSTNPLDTVSLEGFPPDRMVHSATFRPWFRADWLDVLFLHYSIDPSVLQPHVPFDLDLHDGKAWVSLVAFTQSGLRPAAGGRLTSWVTRPVARHVFMNLRTHVRGPRGERAIYFLAEWIPNPLSLMIGPALYGLPLRFADMTYTPAARTVAVGKRRIRVDFDNPAVERGDPALSDFLLERYTALTCRNGTARMFHVTHDPWPAAATGARVVDDSLVRKIAPWFARAAFESAHASAGVRDVAIGSPMKVETPRPVARQPSALVTWTPLVLLPLIALALRPLLPAWAFMWALAYGLFFGSKWATWRQAIDLARTAPRWKSLAYLLAWPGMDARAFLARPSRQIGCGFASWTWPLAKTILGIVFLFTVPRLIAGDHPILAGWAGMTGLILALHFGTFELLALFWQRMGVNAVPIMNAPWRSATLGEFWGARWNRGFRDLSHGWLFRPLLPVLGGFGATYVTFALSGLVHDLVISAPARAGHFLPTLYFLFQAAGLLIERTPWMKRHARGVIGRAFTIAFVALPAPLLFHSAFVLNVILPFFKTIHAI